MDELGSTNGYRVGAGSEWDCRVNSTALITPDTAFGQLILDTLLRRTLTLFTFRKYSFPAPTRYSHRIPFSQRLPNSEHLPIAVD